MRIIILACAFALLLNANAVSADSSSDAAIERAIVLVERIDKKGHCTGVLVAPDIVATVAHCLEDSPLSALRLSMNGTPVPAIAIVAQGAVVTIHTTNHTKSLGEAREDWLLIRISPVSAAPVITDVPSADDVIADAEARGVMVFSYSGRRVHILSACQLRQQMGEGQVADIFGIACDVHGGDSGAPLFLLTPDGPHLIGLIMTGPNRDGVSYAVSTNQFARMLH